MGILAYETQHFLSLVGYGVRKSLTLFLALVSGLYLLDCLLNLLDWLLRWLHRLLLNLLRNVLALVDSWHLLGDLLLASNMGRH